MKLKEVFRLDDLPIRVKPPPANQFECLSGMAAASLRKACVPHVASQDRDSLLFLCHE